ncbi:MAG: hypothetical protein U5P10_02665 [Spirochaetia bacterium]|nr:hypothetical protein [Spirochaetia bacterium]
MSSNHNFQDKPSSEVEAQVLSRIMVLQDMLGSFTEQESMFEFICRGLEEVPGVGEVTNRLSTEKLETEGDTREGFKYFPVFMDRTHFGTLIFEVLDEGRFEPYAPFIQNLCFLTAVVLEERRQRELKEQYSLDLEQRVRRRTRELEASRARTEMERNRAEKYLEVSESLIVELDADLEILTINQHAATNYRLLLAGTDGDKMGRAAARGFSSERGTGRARKTA